MPGCMRPHGLLAPAPGVWYSLRGLGLGLRLPCTQTLAAGGRRDVSSNDAVTALVWVLMCGLRGRPLPGAAHPTAAADGVAGRSSSTTGISEHRRVNVKVVTQQAAPPTGGCLAMAVDLRRNFLSGTLPYSYFGMASWCLHVTGADPLGAAPASGTDGAAAAARGPQHQGQQQELYSAAVSSGPRLRADGRTASTSTLGCKREEEEGQGQQRGGGCGGAGSEAALVAALRHGAGRIRDTLTALRRGPMGAAGAAGQREGGGGAGAGGRDGGDRDGGVAGGDVAVGAALLDLIGEQLSAPARLVHQLPRHVPMQVLPSTLKAPRILAQPLCPESSACMSTDGQPANVCCRLAVRRSIAARRGAAGSHMQSRQPYVGQLPARCCTATPC